MPNVYTPENYGPGVSPLGSLAASLGQSALSSYRDITQQQLQRQIALNNIAMSKREQDRNDIIAGLTPPGTTTTSGSTASVGGPFSTDTGSGLVSPNASTVPQVLRGNAGGLAGALTPSGPGGGANLPGIGGVGQGAPTATAAGPGGVDIAGLVNALMPQVDPNTPYGRSYAGRNRMYQDRASFLASLVRGVIPEQMRASTEQQMQQNTFGHDDAQFAQRYGTVDPNGIYHPGLQAQSDIAAGGPALQLRTAEEKATDAYRLLMIQDAQARIRQGQERIDKGPNGLDVSKTDAQGFRVPTKTDVSSIQAGMQRYKVPPLGASYAPVTLPDSARYLATGDRNNMLSGFGLDTLRNPLPRTLPPPPAAGPNWLSRGISRGLGYLKEGVTGIPSNAPTDSASANALPGGLTSQTKQPVVRQQGGRVVADSNTAPPTVGLPAHPAGPSGNATARKPLSPTEKQAAQSDPGFQKFLTTKGYSPSDWQ